MDGPPARRRYGVRAFFLLFGGKKPVYVKFGGKRYVCDIAPPIPERCYGRSARPSPVRHSRIFLLFSGKNLFLYDKDKFVIHRDGVCAFSNRRKNLLVLFVRI